MFCTQAHAHSDKLNRLLNKVSWIIILCDETVFNELGKNEMFEEWNKIYCNYE